MQDNNLKSKTVKYPESVLKKKSKEVAEITQEKKNLIKNMIKIMIKEQGVGIAAPQVGVSERIIVVNINNQPNVFINPMIIGKSKGTEEMEEGCLSVPGFFSKVKRAKKVRVKAFDLDKKEIEIEAKGLVARIFQHEVDHLNGILFINRIGFWKGLKIKWQTIQGKGKRGDRMVI